MGNCQAAEVEAVVIEHPDGRLERVYWPLSANNVMAANPGHYVAVVTCSTAANADGAVKTVKYLKLLSPNDTLLVGRFYHIISFEDVLTEFGTKKRVRLSKLMRKRKNKKGEQEEPGDYEVHEEKRQEKKVIDSLSSDSLSSDLMLETNNGGFGNIKGLRRRLWRPTLQSIAEFGS